MRYLGGKSRIGYKIACYLNYIRQPGQTYWEPFVGSGWVTQYIQDSPIYCSDKNEYLIAMWQKLLEGWIPPDNVTKEMHERAKRGEFSPELTAFIGFGCSFGGNWFDSFAKGMSNRKMRDYSRESRDKLLEKIEAFQGKEIRFFTADFLESNPPTHNCLIYCDPPYNGVKEYPFCGKFDSCLFWEKVKDLESKGHVLIVSEYKSIPNFSCVNKFTVRDGLGTKSGKRNKIEKLFRYGNHPYFGSETIELF